jgi:hypothetical protein
MQTNSDSKNFISAIYDLCTMIYSDSNNYSSVQSIIYFISTTIKKFYQNVAKTHI